MSQVPSRDATLVADLSHNALVAVSGDDAGAFLHAQFTNDVLALEAGTAQWSSWLSAKGRILATFLLVRRSDHYLMMLPAELAAPILKRLSLFVLRSKVKLEDASERLARLVPEGGLRYAGRAQKTSTATGSHKRHVAEQAALVRDALEGGRPAPALARR